MKSSLIEIERGKRDKMERRILFCALGLILPLLLLLVRLWQIQVLAGTEFSYEAQCQTLRMLRISPVRGSIYDREGNLLVRNKANYDLVFHLSEMRQGGAKQTLQHVMKVADDFSRILGREHGLSANTIRNRLISRTSEPFIVFSYLTEGELAKTTEMFPMPAGVEIRARNGRAYMYPGLASHILGRTGWHVARWERQGEDYIQSFAMQEIIGLTGLEKQYNTELTGSSGEEILQVDASGYQKDKLYEVPAHNGYDLRLSIDIKGQQIAERLLDGHCGAFVVVDVETGGVLVMASAPTYDLSHWSKELYADLIDKEKNPDMPLFHRALDGQYMPGSIFKPLVGLAALESGAIQPDEHYDCIGTFHLGNRKIDCASRAVHGDIDIVGGITMSCNGFFINAGLKTGVDRMQSVLCNAGIGERTEIDFKETVSGVRPSRDILYKRRKRSWLKGDTALASIGQGEVLVTPLQVAIYCAALANGGRLLRPYLVQSVVDENGASIHEAATIVRHRLPVTEEHLEVIRRGMEGAVMAPRGSAKVMRDCGMAVAAKTGTAEVQGKDGKFKNTWIMCYGPLSHPKYSVVCLIERGASGGRTAGPLASQFLQEWLE